MLRARMLKAIEKQGGLGQKLLNKALAIGKERYEQGSIPLKDWPADVAIKLLLKSKVQKKFGGRIKAMVSGGAPLNPDVGLFFHSLGLTVLQGYGQTEAAPVISCNRPKNGIRIESVGPPLKDTEVRFAEDGELLVRGELVMHGYWNNEEETARVLKDGWLHTGDVGHFDEGGRIVITDRKKDLIINDKGDNVSPQRVEGMLTLQAEIAQAMVYGDRRPHLVALLVPEPELVAELNGDKAALKARLQKAMDRVNANLSVIEKVRRFTLADEAFSVDNEQMTPSMKIRRHVLKQVYGDRLNALYGK
jgi:long-chain acyl-CoA synthetase